MANAMALRSAPTPFSVDLGPIPTKVEPEAEQLLARLPGKAVTALLAAVRDWISSQPAVTRARVVTIREPEDPKWTEVVVELHIDADTGNALQMWDDLAGLLNEAKMSLSEKEKQLIDAGFGVHLVWDEEDGDAGAED